MKTQLLYYREMSALRPRLTKTAFWNAVKEHVKEHGGFPLSMDALYDWPTGCGSELDELEDATWADVYAYVYRFEDWGKEAN